MKTKIFSLIAIILIVGATASAQVNTNVGNPIGNPTRAASPRNQLPDLHRSPNPLSENGNMTVTGNVGGLRYFRGPVPYRDRTEFAGPLAYSPVENFLRRSGQNPYRFGYTPYRSSRSVVSILGPGSGGFVVLP